MDFERSAVANNNFSFYRKVVRPRQQRVIEAIKAHSAAKVWYHTCGDCSEYIPDLIEMGVDILNPVQVECAGMGDTRRLKREFGRDLCFWGGLDNQRVLSFGTPEEVRAAVRARVEARLGLF